MTIQELENEIYKEANILSEKEIKKVAQELSTILMDSKCQMIAMKVLLKILSKKLIR